MRAIIMDPQMLIIISSASMFFIALVAGLIYLAMRSGRPSTTVSEEAREIYVCGEPPSVVSSPTGSTESMYWGFVRSIARTLYRYFRDLMHTGKLSDWAGYMSGWYGFLVVIALIAIIYYLALVGGGM